MESPVQSTPLPAEFETHPSRYKHLKLQLQGPVARILLDIQEEHPLRPGYQLKLNSYDLGVDLELADCVQRLRFEHPEVACVVLTSAQPGTFSAGANIFMLGTSSHGFKVNFCKFTNETRLAIEDATENSGQTYIAAINGIASGGGYELPLACKEIYLIDDRRSAVALPEVPYLGVLPGTGGLTRVVDKRKVRRDLADVFVTLAEGIKGKRAVEWGLVDGVFVSSKFNQEIEARSQAVAGQGHPERKGVTLPALQPRIDETGLYYRHVDVTLAPKVAGKAGVATLLLRAPETAQAFVTDDGDAYLLRLFRELDDALLRLRFHHPDIAVVTLTTRGSLAALLASDVALYEAKKHWLANETLHLIKRVLKRFDMTAKSFFALVDVGSCFGGSFLDAALACDRIYMRDDETVHLALSALNAGVLPMGNGLSRMQSRFFGKPEHAEGLMKEATTATRTFSGEEANAAGLVTALLDELDWGDEVRLAVEERAALSPDALTATEQNLRFVGPETLETKIFGRLTAWQNWIFVRPNAVGEKGALTLYGRPESPEFDWRRT